MILQEILESKGYSYMAAVNGQEALRLVNQRRVNNCCREFKVIIMDCEMPVLDGWKATKALRMLSYKGAIIGHTAYAYEQDVERCFQAGMNNVLLKPTQSSAILREIEKYMISQEDKFKSQNSYQFE